MLPLTDLVVPRRIPWVTLTLVAASVGFWLAYQLPTGLEASVNEIGFRACSLAGDCPRDESPWLLTVVTSMFAHGGWAHLVGNMMFLVALGPRVEAEIGPARYGLLYLAAGLAATLAHAGVELAFMTQADSTVPSIGASGAISGVMGAYLVLFPFARILTLLLPMFFLRVPAVGLLGVWFALQALEGIYGLTHPWAEPVGVAFFAHVGGFVAGFLLTIVLARRSWPRRLAARQRRVGPAAAA
jgi:membrane associated rhomboid family serine protease